MVTDVCSAFLLNSNADALRFFYHFYFFLLLGSLVIFVCPLFPLIFFCNFHLTRPLIHINFTKHLDIFLQSWKYFRRQRNVTMMIKIIL